MLFAGSAYSELPISTYKPQELNGDEFVYELIIDQILPGNFEIEQQEDFDLSIQQEFEFNIDFKE